MGLCREPITLPENRYPISSSVLLIRSLHFSRAHTTAFLPSCTLVHTPWLQSQELKTGQYQIYICICNLKSAHSHMCALTDTGVLGKCVISALTKLGQNWQETQGRPCLNFKGWSLQLDFFFIWFPIDNSVFYKEETLLAFQNRFY